MAVKSKNPFPRLDGTCYEKIARETSQGPRNGWSSNFNQQLWILLFVHLFHPLEPPRLPSSIVARKASTKKRASTRGFLRAKFPRNFTLSQRITIKYYPHLRSARGCQFTPESRKYYTLSTSRSRNDLARQASHTECLVGVVVDNLIPFSSRLTPLPPLSFHSPTLSPLLLFFCFFIITIMARRWRDADSIDYRLKGPKKKKKKKRKDEKEY